MKDYIWLNDKKLQKAYMLTILIEKYYEFESAGGHVHIITDDGNYGKEYAKLCKEQAIEDNDFWGEMIAGLLEEFNDEEQEQICERSWEIYEKVME